MSLSFSYLLTVFANLSQQPIKGEIKITNRHEKFLVFLNDTYLKNDYPDLRIQYHSKYTIETLDYIESQILHCHHTIEFKTLNLTYVYNNDNTVINNLCKVSFTFKNDTKLYEVLSTIYYLIKGYQIEELEDSLIVTTPTNNKRTIRYNQSWYCDCNEYNNYYTCQHIKLVNTYLNHRIEFNK